MASPDQSIFRQRALDKYVRRQERQVILRLVSPPLFLFLWALLLLAICAGGIVWSIQQPVLVQGKGVVVEQKAANGKPQQIDVLLVLPPDQQANLKVGQPVTINISSANITFQSTLATVEDGVMSPASISTQVTNNQLPLAQLAQTISGPSIVATAAVEPMSLAQTYLGSQCQAQVQIGTQSALSLLPGVSNLPGNAVIIYQNVINFFNDLLKKL